MMIPPRTMIRNCRKSLFRWKIADSSGDSLTGGQLLTKAIVLRRLLLREVLAPDERYIGILLPPSNGGVIVNAALSLAGRVSANLNYSATSEVMNKCLQKAGIRHVLTSRKVLQKLDLDIDAEVVCLEDFRDRVSLFDKLLGFTLAYAAPASVLDKILGLTQRASDDELTVLFTSGSTGDPKGVLLTHRNVSSNVDAINRAIRLRREDVILGILPFFHAFGYTVALWGPLVLDIHAAHHFTPLDARQIGKLVQSRKATILLSTPTFLRSYLKRCDKEQFASLEIVVAGAEKLPKRLSDAFEEKFGVRPIEGYGATELSPLVSVNVPPSRAILGEDGLREGSVGRPVTDVRAKVINAETGETLPLNHEGMLLITGPNLMKGYLNAPEKTAEVLREGWYVTGDIARLDDEGFIHITGRESRFSKIGGEMVPHVSIEEAIQQYVSGEDEEDLLAVVTAVPDARKGERLVVMHLPLSKTPEEIRRHLTEQGLPNLWVPTPDSFVQVDHLPLLGSGKLDLKALSAEARERFSDDG